jgi:flagellin
MNLSESNSRIVDTDYAQVTADLARSMILSEAGSAMLSQANQQPYYVLALLS